MRLVAARTGVRPSTRQRRSSANERGSTESIPLKDKPLRNYVERSFPAPVDESKDVVQKEEWKHDLVLYESSLQSYLASILSV